MKYLNRLLLLIPALFCACDDTDDPVSSNTNGSGKSQLIFSENFDALPDWTTEEIHNTSDLTAVPERWTGCYASSRWSAFTGYPDKRPSGEIVAENSAMAYGETGKSYVSWRENSTDGQWHSDNVLIKKFDTEYTSLYFEFDIMFSEEMTQSYDNGELGDSKIARVYHAEYESVSQMFSYHAGVQNPALVWKVYGKPQDKQGYGIRNQLAFLTRKGIPYYHPFPGGWISGGGHSASYLTDTRGTMPGGEDPVIINKETGGNLHDETMADFREVFGHGETWTKMAFYVQMNSVPGKHDGVFAQWLDGQRIYFRDDVAWIDEHRDMVGWNTIGIGGNDFIATKDPALQYEEWYSIDNVIVRTTPPAELSLEK